MAEFSYRAWGPIKESDYETAEEFCSACLIDLNPPGKDKTKQLCKLPVKEPKKLGGKVNWNAVVAAAAALAGARGGVNAPKEAKVKAARKLLQFYRAAKKEPPESLVEIVKGD